MSWLSTCRIWAHALHPVTVAVLNDFPPLYSLDDDGQPQGFAIDLLYYVSGEADLGINYLICDNWGQAIEMVRSGKADFIPGIGISDARRHEFAFTDVMETVPVSCFVRKDNYKIRSIGDLTPTVRTAVIDKSAAMTRLRETTNANLVPFPTIDSALIQLLAGDVDAFVFPKPVLQRKLQQTSLENKIKVVGKPLMELKRGYLFKSSNTELFKIVNQAVERVAHSDKYMDIYQRWYGRPTPFWTNVRVVVVMSSLIFIICIVGLIWKYHITKQYNAKLIQTIKERKRVEKDRDNLIKMLEFKNNELQDIVYTASHDLRSPLVNIEGFSGVLREDFDHIKTVVQDQASLATDVSQLEAILQKDIPEALAYISTSTKKMTNLLDGLLQLSRVGSIEIKSDTLRMNRIVADILESMEFQLKENGVSVSVETLPDCQGDMGLVDRIFANLISNAIKYMDPKRNGEINISGHEQDGFSVYCVADNGIGIEQVYQSQIFKIFNRLNPNDAVGGEGLGLAIVSRILDRLNGYVRVESELGVGSRFYVSIPTLRQCELFSHQDYIGCV